MNSLRAYVDALARRGDLRVVDRPVDPHLELGAMIRRGYETSAPAPLFQRILGCEPGIRVLGAPAGLSSDPRAPLARVALSLEADPASTGRELIDRIAGAFDLRPIPPRVVTDGPCKENVLRGADAELKRFPLPLLHDGDGGRYFNTWGTIVVRTPDGSWTNWSIARLMAVDGTTMTGTVLPTQHLGLIYRMWADQGRPMPFALAQGCEPGLPIVSGLPVPEGVDEAGFLGGLLGRPIEVVRCASVDLEVPATAEIVVEGYVPVSERAAEGPMGEYSGYVSGTARPQPVFHIEAITFRREPILPVVVAGEPVDETHTVACLGVGAEALRLLRAAGLPVTLAWLPYAAAGHLLVITVPAGWPELSGLDARTLVERIADVVFHSRTGIVLPKLVVLDDDIDPADTEELMWAMATRVHPRDEHTVLDVEPVMPLAVCYRENERRAHTGPKVAFNGLLPVGRERPRRTGFAHNYPEAVRERVLRHWPAREPSDIEIEQVENPPDGLVDHLIQSRRP